MRIGIARSLIYWKRPYFWEKFFENLGCKVLLSPKTDQEIVEKGVKISDQENCFSLKVFLGHLLWLEKKCDAIFVPRLKATAQKLEYCPKFFALPDLAKIFVSCKVLSQTFDERKEKFEKSILKLAKKLKKTKKEAKKAYQNALLLEKKLLKKKEKNFFKKIKSDLPKLFLISHPYNLEDEYINLRIKEKIRKLGMEPISLGEIPSFKKEKKKSDFFLKIPEFHWEFAREIFEKIENILRYKIEGAIEISSFLCGCDAVIKEFVEKIFKEAGIPFLYLMIDEHTGEAGFLTRLEAFVDTIKIWKKKI